MPDKEIEEGFCAPHEHLCAYWAAMLTAQKLERRLQELEVLIEALKTGDINGSALDAENSFRKRPNKAIGKSRARLASHTDIADNALRWGDAQRERNWLAHEALLEYETSSKAEVNNKTLHARHIIETAHGEVLEVTYRLLEGLDALP